MRGWFTHASNNLKELVWVLLWEPASGIHLVDDERDLLVAELFDEEMAEKVVVAREILHVHDLCRPPCPFLRRRLWGHRGGSHEARRTGWGGEKDLNARRTLAARDKSDARDAERRENDDAGGRGETHEGAPKR